MVFVDQNVNDYQSLVADIQRAINIPLLHIAEATARKIKSHDIHRIGLLGTRFTMEDDFYKGRLIQQYGLDVIIPEDRERNIIDDVIYKELCLGRINVASRRAYQDIIQGLLTKGAEGVILGCTEIGLLVKQEDNGVPLYDTAQIHAEAAVAFALEED